MALIVRSLQLSRIQKISAALTTVQIRQGSHWFPDFKPGPYPKTKEEREAAAKKYNLLPEEYEPVEDKEFGCGDYPKLPFESIETRDSYHNWDDPDSRRDYMEPVNKKIMMLLPQLISTAEPKYPMSEQLRLCLTTVGVVVVVLYFLHKYIIEIPTSAKEYPAEGVKHYLFEIDHKKE